VKIPRSKPLVVSLPKEHNYRIEEGKYRARLHKITRTHRQNGSGRAEVLRLVFELMVQGKEHFINLAKVEFPLNLEHGSELRKVLTRLIGKEALADLSGQEFDFETMVGKEADVEIEHIITSRRENYDYPFVQIRDIQPAGTLVETKPVSLPEQPKELVK
jgi:hypothetical protein